TGDSRVFCGRSKNHEDGGEQETNCRDTAAAASRAQLFRQRVADRSAQRAANGHRQKAKRRVERTGFQVQSADARQVDINPAEKDPCNIAETEISERNDPDVRATQNGEPLKAAAFRSHTFGKTLLDQGKFGRRDGRMRFRFIARSDKPYSSDDESDQSA